MGEIEAYQETREKIEIERKKEIEEIITTAECLE